MQLSRFLTTARPEPILRGLVPLVVAVAAMFGLQFSDADVNVAIDLLLGAVASLSALAPWFARNVVTPLADPRDADGVPLVRKPGYPTTD